MKINLEALETLWYTDEAGNRIPCDPSLVASPTNAMFMHSQHPCTLTESILLLVKQEDVDRCRHPRKYVVPTYGWVAGVYGRECRKCHGTQIRHKYHLWPRKWNGHRSAPFFEGHATWSPDLALAIANSGDYPLDKAILIVAQSCERCMNALAHKYGLSWGYPEDSDEYRKCNTSCSFCREG